MQNDMGNLPDGAPTSAPSRDRLVYLQHLREAHDGDGFCLARADALAPPDEELERFLFESEMLANYGVI